MVFQPTVYLLYHIIYFVFLCWDLVVFLCVHSKMSVKVCQAAPRLHWGAIMLTSAHF